MCGIAGMVASDPVYVADAAVVHTMCEQIVHRGPDDEGLYAAGPAGIGMRRLSIIDLAGGHQPIHNEDNSIWIVFNGEIYNFPELRREMEAAGHRFYTRTDTEAIVHLYEHYGVNCVHKLRGMFTFAIWDERRHRLLLARDRLGIKPLHYALHNGVLYFASEIKSILAVAPELATPDRESLLHYFCYGHIADPRTAFPGIHKLPPGHLADFSAGRLNIRQYWDLPEYSTWNPRSEQECLDELEPLLADAVRMRLISDVPIGAMLSGGVDSSIVVALMARASSGPVKTFTIGLPTPADAGRTVGSRPDWDETQYAREVARIFGTDHHELFLEPDIQQLVLQMSHALDEPFADSSVLPTFLVSQLARRHVTVALSGDGGDELFGGYERYALHMQRSRVAAFMPGFVAHPYLKLVFPHLGPQAKGRRYLYNLALSDSRRYVDSVSCLPPAREGSIYSRDFRDWAGLQPDPARHLLRYWHEGPAHDTFTRLLYLDTKTYLPSGILTKVDRASMLTSLEARVPVLDHKFVEKVTSLDSRWKFRNGDGKYIFKKLAQRLGIPQHVIYRRKRGFSMPLVHWMRHECRDFLQLLLEPRTLQRGYFDGAAVRALLDEHTNGVRDRSATLWLLLMFELWHRNFIEKISSAQVPSRPPANVAEAPYRMRAS